MSKKNHYIFIPYLLNNELNQKHIQLELLQKWYGWGDVFFKYHNGRNFTGTIELKDKIFNDNITISPFSAIIKDGRLHSDIVPALTFKSNSIVYAHYWFKNGTIHYDKGPAYRDFGQSEERKQYYINNKHLTFDQYWEIQKDTEYASIIMADRLGNKNE